MKSPSHTSSSRGPALLAASVALLFGAATASAQSGGAGATSAGSSQKNPPGAASSGSTYGTGSSSAYDSTTAPATGTGTTPRGANADVSATHDINSHNAAASTSVGAGAMTGRETNSNGKLSWTDRRFVTKAADGGMAEVQVAQLAAQRASNPEVKSFAQKLVDDHTQVNSELMSLAGQKNVKMDNDDDKDRAYKRLNKKSGEEFDQEFVEHMIDEHEKDIKLFEKASSDAKDADVRAFASKHLDHLREHLQAAQNLRESVMPTGRMDKSSGRSLFPRHHSTSSTSSTSADPVNADNPKAETSASPDSLNRATTPKR